MIHKNRGNRRWMDKRKRRSKYNLCQRIWGDAMYFLDGILGKYDNITQYYKDNTGLYLRYSIDTLSEGFSYI